MCAVAMWGAELARGAVQSSEWCGAMCGAEITCGAMCGAEITCGAVEKHAASFTANATDPGTAISLRSCRYLPTLMLCVFRYCHSVCPVLPSRMCVCPRAMRCPVLPERLVLRCYATILRACYAVSGTDAAYAATSCPLASPRHGHRRLCQLSLPPPSLSPSLSPFPSPSLPTSLFLSPFLPPPSLPLALSLSSSPSCSLPPHALHRTALYGGAGVQY
eukprot:415981-Rhodomonas_salina.1